MTKRATPSTSDIEQFLSNPGAVFSHPEQVLAHADLSDPQKIEILRRWAYDANEESVAVEEGMPGGEADLLQSILRSLNQLVGEVDVDHVGPTKQHGIPRSAVKPG